MAGDVPTSTMQSFFHDDRAVEDLESKSLLSIAVTELVDGVFIACSMSHIVADGNSFWHFFNMWSEVFQQQVQEIVVTMILSRLEPPLSQDYFRNSVHTILVIAMAGELSEKGVGWVAWQLHQAVANYSDKQVRQWLHKWLQSPYTWKADHTISISSVLVDDCTKFNISRNEFGILGKPIAFNFGDRTHMINGYVYAYSDPDPDPTAAGDILVEVSLLPHTMRDLQADQEFMQFIS
nr:protein ENHANCED PSEUDOMONAS SUSCEPTIBILITY 1-like [Ziziphus jujuba var. spinosa]